MMNSSQNLSLVLHSRSAEHMIVLTSLPCVLIPVPAAWWSGQPLPRAESLPVYEQPHCYCFQNIHLRGYACHNGSQASTSPLRSCRTYTRG